MWILGGGASERGTAKPLDYYIENDGFTPGPDQTVELTTWTRHHSVDESAVCCLPMMRSY